ncbi:MAG: CDP-alcohol phosphatidyltransferase family protein, partial [Burkholderiales bacterium]
SSVLWLLAIALPTECLDGYLARRLDQSTRLGAVLDPLADKLLIGSLALLLASQGLLPAWLAGAIVTRDVVIVGGALSYHFLIEEVPMTPAQLSKLNTGLQLSTLFLVLVGAAGWMNIASLLPAAFMLTFVITVSSGIHYAWS